MTILFSCFTREGAAIVTGVVSAAELQTMEREFEQDLASLIDLERNTWTDGRLYGTDRTGTRVIGPQHTGGRTYARPHWSVDGSVRAYEPLTGVVSSPAKHGAQLPHGAASGPLGTALDGTGRDGTDGGGGDRGGRGWVDFI